MNSESSKRKKLEKLRKISVWGIKQIIGPRSLRGGRRLRPPPPRSDSGLISCCFTKKIKCALIHVKISSCIYEIKKNRPTDKMTHKIAI